VNPYDQELADVDLFALIEKNLKVESFFLNFVDAGVSRPPPKDKPTGTKRRIV
jgi:hypothetical protein